MKVSQKLLEQVSDGYHWVRLKVSALLSMLLKHLKNVLAKLRGSN
jgi:hypothetical protein